MKYALIGSHIEHSLSPTIHLAFAQQFNLAIQYDLIEATAENLTQKIKDFFAHDGIGLNITAPFKQSALQFATVLSESARATQSINVLTKQADGSLIGDNTDGIGFTRSLSHHQLEIKNKTILILGAGGAVRGIFPEILKLQPKQVLIANRNQDKASKLIDGLNQACNLKFAQTAQDIADVDLIIHACSASTDNVLLPLLNDKKLTNSYFYDLNYGNKSCAMQKVILQYGFINYIDGFSMLVEQASAAFYLWHDLQPRTAYLYQSLPAI